MLSASAATQLLERADSAPRLAPIAAELGFSGSPQRLEPELCTALALPQEVAHARLAVGDGALRALVVQLADDAGTRDAIVRIARSLAARAAHCLWLILGVTPRGGSVFVAAPARAANGANVRAMVVDRNHVHSADAETLAALAASTAGPDLLVHARWLEVLGRDSISRRFYTDLVRVVGGLADSLDAAVTRSVRAELALLNVSRLLFLAFLQARGWLNADHAFLQNAYDAGIGSGGRVHKRILEPLFFGTLNTRSAGRQPRARAFGALPYLNGGLFARTHAERAHRNASFTDEALGAVFGDLLTRYRFTPREEGGDWSDAAVDPAILGRAFESLMDQGERRQSGTFYTPQSVVERATRAALSYALECEGALEEHSLTAADRRGLLGRLPGVRVLDPACGSGAFLVHVMRELAELRVRLTGEPRGAARSAVLAGSIHGVDINPTAVWLCQLRLWLCLAVEYDAECARDVPPLPNLDRNIRVGDTLTGFGPVGRGQLRVSEALARTRTRYARAHGARKRTLARQLDLLERQSAIAAVDSRIGAVTARRCELLSAARSPDLFGTRHGSAVVDATEIRRLRLEARAARAERQRLRSGAALEFSFDVQFADVMQRGGFDAVVGNPPWVRPHRLSARTRSELRSRFSVWQKATGVRAPAFGQQTDIAAPFVERSLTLLRPGGALALLVPAKLWSCAAGASLRRYLMESSQMLSVEDFSEAAPMFDAAAYPSLLVAARPTDGRTATDVQVAVHRRSGTLTWRTSSQALGVDPDIAAPWILVPREVRQAFEALNRAGVPLARTSFGPPRLGVKTGCNRAFIVQARASCQALVEVSSGDVRGWVERPLLRPALRGELVRAWRRSPGNEFIIWTHDRADRPLTQLPLHAGRWLRQWKHALATRADARESHAWWRLFRTPAARGHAHRVVWCDIGRAPRALVLAPGDPTVPVNTCYVTFAAEEEAYALCALLNSQLAAAWLNVVAEPARGGYRRYLGWTMSLLPLPADAQRFVQTLAPPGRAGTLGDPVAAPDLLNAVMDAYDVTLKDIRALLEWQDV